MFVSAYDAVILLLFSAAYTHSGQATLSLAVATGLITAMRYEPSEEKANEESKG